MQVLDWVKKNYQCDTTVLRLRHESGRIWHDGCLRHISRQNSGRHGLCGGTSLKDVSGLGKLPFWIIHGTADRAVSIGQSKVVVEKLQNSNNDSRLRYDWLQGGKPRHASPHLLSEKTYDWLFSHCLLDKNRPVNKDIDIGLSDIHKAYSDIRSGTPDPEIIDGPSITTGNEY